MEKKRINGVINIPTSLSGSFFRFWLEFLAPFHHLANREMEVAACFLKHRYILGKAINDDDLLDSIVMNEDTKKKIRQECEMAQAHFQVIMGKLRKANFIINNKINPKFIPKNMSENDTSFQLLLHFDLDGRDS